MVELVKRGHDGHQREPRAAEDHSREHDRREAPLSDLPRQRDQRQRPKNRREDHGDVHDAIPHPHVARAEVITEQRVDGSEQRQLRNAEPRPAASGEDPTDADELGKDAEVVS